MVGVAKMWTIRIWIRALALVVLIDFIGSLRWGSPQLVVALVPALLGAVAGTSLCWQDARTFRARRRLAAVVCIFAGSLLLTLSLLTLEVSLAQCGLIAVLTVLVGWQARRALARSRFECISEDRPSPAQRRVPRAELPGEGRRGDVVPDAVPEARDRRPAPSAFHAG